VNNHCHEDCYSTELSSCAHPHFLYNKTLQFANSEYNKDPTTFSYLVLMTQTNMQSSYNLGFI